MSDLESGGESGGHEELGRIGYTLVHPENDPDHGLAGGGGGGGGAGDNVRLTLTQWQKSQLQGGLSQKGIQCLINNWISLARNPIQGLYCDVAWDEIYCWPATLAGENVSRPCSEVMKDDAEIDSQNITGDAYRICAENGTWLHGNWTNYSVCLSQISDSTVLEEDHSLAAIVDAVRYILFIGSILSLLCLCLALFIFNYFKSIRCDRITVHVHLMLSLALRSCLLIIITEPFIFQRTNHYRTVDWICKVVLALQFYAMVSSINWMFIQGHYLHSRLTTKVFDHGIPMKLYCGLGWGVPFGLISLWSYLMETYHAKPCWKNYGSLVYINWIIVGPMLFVLLVNLLFLINIMRILLTKIQLTSAASESEQFRRAVKATAILFPLLGINNLLFFYNPGGQVETYYMLSNTVLQSSQGVFVSFLYCFCCKDVKDAIRREYGRFSARRSANTSANSMRSQSRRSCGGGGGGSGRSFKDKILMKRASCTPLTASYTRSHNQQNSEMTTTVPPSNNDDPKEEEDKLNNIETIESLQKASDTEKGTKVPTALHLNRGRENCDNVDFRYLPNNGIGENHKQQTMFKIQIVQEPLETEIL